MAIMNARLALTHPNRKRLLAWLDRELIVSPVSADGRARRVDEAVTAHVEHCDRCADRLEHLSGDETQDESPGNIGVALRDVYQPPQGINDRVLRAIDDRKRVDEEVNLFLGLFSIATDAADLMLPDGHPLESKTSDENGRDREDES
jgi:hypothetical protein